MDITDLEFRYSGGSANSDQASSIGGVMSSEQPVSHSIAATTIAGVTITEVSGIVEGDATLYFYPSNDSIAMAVPNGGLGPAVRLLTDGLYTLYGAEGPEAGYIVVSVVVSSLGGQVDVDNVAVTVTPESLFPDVTYNQATSGYTQYRCVYLTNTHGTHSLSNVGLYILSETEGEDTISVAFDTDAGVDGLATTLVDETDPTALLTSLSFTAVDNVENAVLLDLAIAAGSRIPIWVKRSIPAYTAEAVSANAFSIGLKAYMDI